ncbi:DUF4870 domain-containing protein [Microbacterium sp. No. 7]|uniref:DUF4870 domain-containing protein n=1 Tax=Microbacterium sp. No. 7 TaxID=1714373 RepID=UPI0006CF36B5|nr:DUF4870 domain-containing protein [Microbacterium sp. No. 7]ALJ21157.1 hypothetical protein AOA12_15100 [Microbacterium sp. No. 7]
MSDPNAAQPGDITPPPAPGHTPPPAPGATPPPQGYAPPPAPGAAPQGYAAAPAAGAPLAPASDQQAAMWAHIGGIVGFLPSLIIWLLLKDRGPRTAVEAKEALNWQITFTIVYVVLWIVTTILSSIVWVLGLFLWLLPLAWWVLNVVWSIMGGMRVNAGGGYQYPINFRFIK